VFSDRHEVRRELDKAWGVAEHSEIQQGEFDENSWGTSEEAQAANMAAMQYTQGIQ
jgi:hypothetical protein